MKSSDDLRGSEKRSLRRQLKLLIKKDLVRPLHHLRESDTVSQAERQLDSALSRMMLRLLNLRNLQSCYANTSFGKLHYYDSAPGSRERPLILQHGIGSSGQCWSVLAAVVKERRRLVIPDLFDFCGFSRRITDSPLSVSDHTKALRQLADSLGQTSVDYCGLSLGGWIGLTWALQAPGEIKSLMLHNSAGLRFGAISLRDRLLTMSWEKFQREFPGVMYASPYQGVPGVSPVVKRSLFRILKDPSVRDFLKTVTPNDFVDHQLGKLTCPTHLLWGDRDSFISQKSPHYFCRNIPNIQGYFVQDCAHILCLEAPINVLKNLDCFFELGLDWRRGEAAALSRIFPLYPEREVTSNRDRQAGECLSSDLQRASGDPHV